MPTIDRRTHVGMAIVVGVVVFLAAAHAQNPPPGPPGFPGMPDLATMFQERPVLAQFDASKDGRLDCAERQSARVWLATQPPVGLSAVIGRLGPPVLPEPLAPLQECRPSAAADSRLGHRAHG